MRSACSRIVGQHAGAIQQVLPIVDFESSVIARPQTFWLVVYHRDEDGIRLEVSLPAGVNEDGTIVGWDNRIVLDDVTANDQSMEVRNEERGEDDDVTVAISER